MEVATPLDNKFDGDTGSATILMTREALEENEAYLGTRQAWVSTDGKLRASAAYDTLELVVRNLTGRYGYQQEQLRNPMTQ